MKLAIYGTGNSGLEMLELITYCEKLRNQWEELVFIDDTKAAGEFHGCRMFPFHEFSGVFQADEIEVIIAVGEPANRKALYEKVVNGGYRLGVVVHPTSVVSPSAVLKAGAVIKDSVSISSGAVIGENVYINGISLIGHGVVIGPHSQISSHVVIAGNTTVGTGVYVGVSACVRDHIEIGENAIVAMGAVVMKSVRPGRTAMGNPAREIAENKDHQVFK